MVISVISGCAEDAGTVSSGVSPFDSTRMYSVTVLSPIRMSGNTEIEGRMYDCTAETARIAEIAGVDLDEFGFIKTGGGDFGSVTTSREGIYLAGSVEGPKDIQGSVIQAESAAGQVMKSLGGSDR